MSESTRPDPTSRTRRSLLAAAAGGAAALAAGAISPKTTQAASVAVMTEIDNVADTTTSITTNDASHPAFIARGTGGGTALETVTSQGVGVIGTSLDSSDPATNLRNTGILGVAGSNSGVAANTSLTGVYGYSVASPVGGFVGAGVWGDSPEFGVIGTGGVGVLGDGTWGVRGFTSASDGIGVLATSSVATGRALRVEGRAEFSRSGRTSIATGASTKKVTLAGCTTSTLVLAVLASNRSGRYVRAVVPSAGYFTIYLNTTVLSTTNIVWMAFTNPSNHSG